MGGVTTGTKYKVRIEADGADVKVWRSPASGGAETLVFDRNDLPEYDGNRFSLLVSADTAASLDDILILADDHERETTFTPATNNELASSTDYNGTTTYAFDNWGRLSTESRGGVTKTYSWTMANLLAGVNSSDANDTDVSYLYTGDLKRLFRFENGNLKNSYGWDAGFNVVDETEWSGGSPVADKAYAEGLAEVDTTGTPLYAYLTHDHLGSTRGLWDGSINQTGDWEYTPYGAPLNFAGPPNVTQLYTGHDFEPATGHHYAPFRTLNPNTARWNSADPMGMVDGTNMFRYVKGNPINLADSLGLYVYDEEQTQCILDEIANSSPWDLFNEFLSGGGYDFSAHGADTYKVPGYSKPLNANEFGNYAAGYAGAANGIWGPTAARVAGHALEFGQGGNDYWWDDPASRRWINRGVRDGRRRYGNPWTAPFRALQGIWDGLMNHGAFPY